MFRVELRLDGLITTGAGEIDLGKSLDLLEAIAQRRSVQGASEHLGLSYRSSWGRVAELERAFGRPLVLKTKGHGSSLTAFGAEIRDALRAALERFEGPLSDEARSLEGALSRIAEHPSPTLRLAASHDPVLLSALRAIAHVEVTTVGSRRAIEALRSDDAAAAGFHFGALGPAEGPFADVFEDRSIHVRPLFVREQGLMLASGNPLHIRSVQDIAGRKCRFVNRQSGSGTRIWFDQLLRSAGLHPRAIAGYDVEEFTHQAVAAVIASGAADAGMGVRAVAERFGLAFVPIGWETYYLATAEAVSADVAEQIVASVRRQLDGTPGYGLPRSV